MFRLLLLLRTQEERERKRGEIQSLKREILVASVRGRGQGREAPIRRMLDRSLTGAKKLRAIARVVTARAWLREGEIHITRAIALTRVGGWWAHL